ncbi:PDZ domain-containing protein [Hymenobacter cellulosilyticus]|uniref:PDZ domain-containing protein n=1 Tax=Hymenobacter cellulosilyticus TaxID=2932248 RepID=A0A8T9QDY3_9BACT|nr:PDZ domain-containing protein [Hymenobacter cellulosilyticus]UOQ74621.1 PDZ domain-containing protein [Hymenobacter cellulosilyticus]
MRRVRAGQASLVSRLSFNPADSTASIGSTLVGSPLYQAGLDREDVLRKIDGQRLSSAKAVQELLAAHKPGDVVPVEYRTRGGIRTAQVTLAEDPTLEVVTNETAQKPVTKAMKKFRADWLSGKAK